MDISVNYLAILAAGIISIITGSLWYGPLFGEYWMKTMKFKKPAKMDDEAKMAMMKSYGITTVASLVMAYVLSHIITFSSAYMGVSGVSAGLSSAFWMWLGFIVPTSLNSVLWEGKPLKLWFINVGYHLVTLLIIGPVIAVWR